MMRFTEWSKRSVVLFLIFSLLATISSPPVLAVGEENPAMVRIRKNVDALRSEPVSMEQESRCVKGIVCDIYALVHSIPYPIDLKRTLVEKDADADNVERKRHYFLSIVWVILQRAGFDVESVGNSISIKGDVCDVNIRTDLILDQCVEVDGKRRIDICIHYLVAHPNGHLTYPYTIVCHLPQGQPPAKRQKTMAPTISKEIPLQQQLRDLISGGQDEVGITRFETTLLDLFSGLPPAWRIDREAYYHSLFHIYFILCNAKIVSESCSSEGRLDSYVEIGKKQDKKIIVFEFKYNDSTGKATKQVMDTGYCHKFFLDTQKPVDEVFFVGCRFIKQGCRADHSLEPTCWPFKCSRIDETIVCESLRGTSPVRKQHTYTDTEISDPQHKRLTSIGTTPKKPSRRVVEEMPMVSSKDTDDHMSGNTSSEAYDSDDDFQ